MSSYGYNDDPYAAQQMFQVYSAGQDVGDIESTHPLGAVGEEAVPNKGVKISAETGALIADATVGLLGTGIGLLGEKKRTEAAQQHELNMLAQQAEIARLEEQRAQAGAIHPATIIGGLAVLGLVIGGAIYVSRGRK
jgi:hypothetical protein